MVPRCLTARDRPHRHWKPLQSVAQGENWGCRMLRQGSANHYALRLASRGPLHGIAVPSAWQCRWPLWCCSPAFWDMMQACRRHATPAPLLHAGTARLCSLKDAGGSPASQQGFSAAPQQGLCCCTRLVDLYSCSVLQVPPGLCQGQGTAGAAGRAAPQQGHAAAQRGRAVHVQRRRDGAGDPNGTGAGRCSEGGRRGGHHPRPGTSACRRFPGKDRGRRIGSLYIPSAKRLLVRVGVVAPVLAQIATQQSRVPHASVATACRQLQASVWCVRRSR